VARTVLKPARASESWGYADAPPVSRPGCAGRPGPHWTRTGPCRHVPAPTGR
jgi:hypothetical protein